MGQHEFGPSTELIKRLHILMHHGRRTSQKGEERQQTMFVKLDKPLKMGGDDALVMILKEFFVTFPEHEASNLEQLLAEVESALTTNPCPITPGQDAISLRLLGSKSRWSLSSEEEDEFEIVPWLRWALDVVSFCRTQPHLDLIRVVPV